MNIKQKIRGLVPQSVREWVWDAIRAPLNLVSHHASDGYRFWKHNISVGRMTAKSLTRNMMTYTHMLEKGLSLREPRPFFGPDVVRRLMQLVKDTESGSDVSPAIITSAVGVLENYVEFHEDKPATDDQREYISGIKEFVSGFQGKEEDPKALIRQTRREVLEVAAGGSITQQLKSRHSVRVFDDRSVPVDTIVSAVEAAQSSPSACNLQPVRVYVLTERKLIDDALAVQGGARGFYSEVKLLFVITYEIALQIGPRSRNQGYIDGGLFSQNLMLSLLKEGVGSCPLNWAQERSTDRTMRELVGIRRSENIVMLIAAGHLPEDYSVAQSKRVETEGILTFVNG